MKAVYIEEHGGPEVLTYGERPEPIIGCLLYTSPSPRDRG